MENNDSNSKIDDGEKSESEDSEDNLKIVTDSPLAKRKPKFDDVTISQNDIEIIETVATTLEKTLEEKAAKANLTTLNVKKILKHVVTNEHVLALVRQAEDPDHNIERLTVYEPKLTRAKAKELLSSQPVATLPWLTPNKSSSEVQVLISEELQEDSSGDEYIPAEEESEDDKDNSMHHEPDHQLVGPSTLKSADSATQTSWSEDGIFKIPQTKTKSETEEEANIAKRTRSKLSLSSTPLETIEEAFIPPDITTDMYDMDCDDDDWKDFLKTFTRPLDEVARDDEDHDPEYNVLADEEIDEVDKEELRADKAVKVSRKEYNELMAELYEYADNFSQQNQQCLTPCIEQTPQFTLLENGTVEETVNNNAAESELQNIVEKEVKIDETMITETQKLLLQQQMRQHVQILTQNFILCYAHPEYSELATKCKEYLFNLKGLSANKVFSYFSAINLQDALALISCWEERFETHDHDAEVAKEYVARVYHECKTAIMAGNEYIPTFPQLVLQTITKSSVFLYVSLLPKIPFKPVLNNAILRGITKSENELIALGLEQFIPFLSEDPHHISKNGKVRMKHVCHYIQRYMMPTRDYIRIYGHVNACKNPKSEPNPILYYFQNNKAPITIHYVVDVNQLGVLPPTQRSPNELPYQWKKYLYPHLCQPQTLTNIVVPVPSNNFTKVTRLPCYRDFVAKKRKLLPKASNTPRPLSHINSIAKRRIKFENEPVKSFNDFKINSQIASTPLNHSRKLEYYFKSQTKEKNESNLLCLKFNSTIFKHLGAYKSPHHKMLPSMPMLNTPFRKSPERSATPPIAELPHPFENTEENVDEASNISKNDANPNDELTEKDNNDEINALIVASSTIKPARKKTLSGAEKKKAKLKKDLSATLSILTDENEVESDEKINRYVQAFYDKLQERLDLHEYHRLVEILNNFEENQDSVVDLYKNVNDILSPKYPDLTDEFLCFLTSSQAKAVGRLEPHIMINNMSLFLRKLEMYFKGQPSQAKKIFMGFTELANCIDVTMDRVRSTIIPLLKGNKLLIDWFLQIFPCEKPTQSLLSGSWESIEIGKDNSFNSKDDVYETVIVPEVEDPYGGPNCICFCHNVEDQTFKSRSRHCLPCGTKFLQGRIYVHTGKGLRLAKVSYDSGNAENYKRLGYQSSVQHHKRRQDVSPSKQSPNKDVQDDVRMSNESEDDDCARKKLQKLSKTPRKRRPKPKREKKIFEEQKPSLTNTVTSEQTTQEDVKDTQLLLSEQMQRNLNNCNPNEPEHVAEEAVEWDCNTSIESIELKQSPEHSAESESGETSQDNINTDSDCSTENISSPLNVHSENSNSNPSDEMWTKDEDKIILETFRREGDKEETYQHIAQLLENRSVSKVKNRFQTLLNLLQEMAAKKVL